MGPIKVSSGGASGLPVGTYLLKLETILRIPLDRFQRLAIILWIVTQTRLGWICTGSRPLAMKAGMDATQITTVLKTYGLSALLCGGLALTGCGTVRNTNTARSGTEQMLLSSAFDEALRRIDFSPLENAPVYFETKNIEAVDKGWVISSIREAMLVRGVRLMEKPEQASVIVEARIGALGTDDFSFLIGIPQITVPATITGMPMGTIPEIALMKKADQKALSKVALFAYDKASGGVVWTSGTSAGFANSRNLFIGGLGPIQSGTHKRNPEFMGVVLPQMTVQPVPIPILPWSEEDPDASKKAALKSDKTDSKTPASTSKPMIDKNLNSPEMGGQEPGTVVPIPIPLPTAGGSPFSMRLFNGFAPKDKGLLQSKATDSTKPASATGKTQK